jgi:GTPase SAR1 family protein
MHKGVVTFIDTAGQEQYVEARREAIGSAQGFLLVYDVTQPYVFAPPYSSSASCWAAADDVGSDRCVQDEL